MTGQSKRFAEIARFERARLEELATIPGRPSTLVREIEPHKRREKYPVFICVCGFLPLIQVLQQLAMKKKDNYHISDERLFTLCVVFLLVFHLPQLIEHPVFEKRPSV